MFGSSTQLNYWTFKSERDLENLRKEANKNYIDKHGTKKTKEEQQTYFLSAEEELILVLEYRRRLSEFCNAFRDPRDQRIRMPVSVTTTALHYLGRFYLYNSVMDYLPQIIMHTCIYLACKIEEFYVTITDYVHNLQGSEMDKMLMASAILNCELQTMQELQFHLIVHQPFRPVEGLLIDLKTRYPSLKDAESLRAAVEEFLERAHLTDTPLLYAPSQLALAAVTTAASKLGQNLDSYVTDTLFGGAGDRLLLLIDAVRKIKRLVKGCSARARAEVVEDLERRLAVCRNPVHDPSTVEYRRHQARLLQDHDDDDDGPLISSAGVTEDEEGDDEGLHVINNTANNDSCSSNGNSNDMSFQESNDSSHLVATANREQQHEHQNGHILHVIWTQDVKRRVVCLLPVKLRVILINCMFVFIHLTFISNNSTETKQL